MLQREAESKRNTVFIRRSNRARPDYQLTTQDVEELLANFVPPRDVTLVARGKSGYAATFYGSGAVPGNSRAQQFVTEAPRVNPNIWCVVERPQDLRAILVRAHDFGAEFKKYCSLANEEVNSYYSLQGEFLLVGEIVVGPLTMIPAENSWNRVFREICRIHTTEKPTRPNLRQPLQSQLWSSLVELLAECVDKIKFLGPPPSLSPPPSPKQRQPADLAASARSPTTSASNLLRTDASSEAPTSASAADAVPPPSHSSSVSSSPKKQGSSKSSPGASSSKKTSCERQKSDAAVAKRRRLQNGDDDDHMDVTDETIKGDFEDVAEEQLGSPGRHAFVTT